jgi:hypothetical protein
VTIVFSAALDPDPPHSARRLPAISSMRAHASRLDQFTEEFTGTSAMMTTTS